MRFRTGLATAALAATALLGLSACGSGGGPEQVALTGAQQALSVEGQALSALGFATEDLAAGPSTDPGADPSAAAGSGSGGQAGEHRPGNRRSRVRVLLRRNTLHGEAVVKTKDGGTRTVAVQRGTITAIDATSITVKSADGFTQKWSLGTPLRVIEHRTTIQPSQLAVGREVGVAGEKSGDTGTAHLVVVPKTS